MAVGRCPGVVPYGPAQVVTAAYALTAQQTGPVFSRHAETRRERVAVLFAISNGGYVDMSVFSFSFEEICRPVRDG